MAHPGTQPTLSVILPNFNHGRYLESSLSGLVTQDRPATEIIIIDDGSTDGSRGIIEKYAAGHSNIRAVFHEKNLGANRTVDELMEMASCEYLFPYAADDIILPGFFSKSFALLERHPEAAFCSSLFRIIDENGVNMMAGPRGVVKTSPAYISPEEAKHRLLWHSPWYFGNSLIYRRDALIRSGGFRRELGPACDGIIKDVLAMRHGVCFIPEVLACWRYTGENFYNTYCSVPENYEKLTGLILSMMKTDYADVFTERHRRLFETRSLFFLKTYKNDVLRQQSGTALRRRGLGVLNLFYTVMRRMSYLAYSPPWEWWRTFHYFAQSYWVYWRRGLN